MEIVGGAEALKKGGALVAIGHHIAEHGLTGSNGQCTPGQGAQVHKGAVIEITVTEAVFHRHAHIVQLQRTLAAGADAHGRIIAGHQTVAATFHDEHGGAVIGLGGHQEDF